MKKALISFLLGLVAGAGGYWYLVERHDPERFASAKDAVLAGATNVKDAVVTGATKAKEAVADMDVNQIKEELSRTSMVVREKAKAAGDAIADTTANLRTTAAIKGKLAAEVGVAAMYINVDTTAGLVTLSGTASSHEEVAKAIKLALETEGVRKVISTLQVSAKK